jgi:hypothetical protein
MSKQPHNMNVEMQYQVHDGMGKIKRIVKNDKLGMLSPFVTIGNKMFPGRSFVKEYLEALLEIFTSGAGAPWNVTGNADADVGIMLGWNTNTAVRYVSPTDTDAGMRALTTGGAMLYNLPSTNDGYGANVLNAGIIPSATPEGLLAAKIQLTRLFTNSATEKAIREVFLVGKKSTTYKLFSRDNYSPRTAEAGKIIPRAELLAATEALNVTFDFFTVLKKDNLILHENFVKYLYNVLFVGSVANGVGLQMLNNVGTLGDPVAAAYGKKATADTVASGMDILLSSSGTGIVNEDFVFSTNGSDVGDDFANETNTEFSTKTVSLDSAVSVDNRTAKFNISKIFSGHTADYKLSAAHLIMDDVTPTPDARYRLVTWQKGMGNAYDTISLDDYLKVIFTFSVDCGTYSSTVNTPTVKIDTAV